LTLNEKKVELLIVEQSVCKRCQNIFYWV